MYFLSKVKDCVTGGMAVTKQPSNDQKYEPIVQFDVKILASKGKDKVSFQVSLKLITIPLDAFTIYCRILLQNQPWDQLGEQTVVSISDIWCAFSL